MGLFMVMEPPRSRALEEVLDELSRKLEHFGLMEKGAAKRVRFVERAGEHEPRTINPDKVTKRETYSKEQRTPPEPRSRA